MLEHEGIRCVVEIAEVEEREDTTWEVTLESLTEEPRIDGWAGETHLLTFRDRDGSNSSRFTLSCERVLGRIDESRITPLHSCTLCLTTVLPFDRPVLLFVLSSEDILDTLFEFEHGFFVGRVNEETLRAFFLEVDVSFGGRDAAVDHDKGESEECRFGVTVRAVEKDSTRKSVRVVRRTGLIADPKGEVDNLVSIGGTSPTRATEGHRTRKCVDVDNVVDRRTKDCRLVFVNFLSVDETTNILESLTLFLKCIESVFDLTEEIGRVEMSAVVRFDADGEGFRVSIFEKA